MAQAPSSTHSASPTCFFLLGKTGHGKSATGNVILGKKSFKSLMDTTSVTMKAEVDTGEINGRQVKVVDTPGLSDTRLESHRAATFEMDAFSRGVALCPEGFHALILVFRLGIRVTAEEQEAIERLKELLGENIIREYSIIVITHGDNFDEEEVGKPFIQWLRSQGGYMRTLLQECDNRCVLFSNKTKDKAEMSRQRQELLNCVDTLQSKGKRYTNFVFEQAKKTYEQLTTQREYIEVTAKVNTCLGDISNNLLTAQEKGIKMDDAYYEGLRKKLQGLNGLMTNLTESDKKKVKDQLKQMDERIQSVQKKQGDEEKMQQELAKLRKQTEELKKQQEMDADRYQRDFVDMQNNMFAQIAKMQEVANENMRALVKQIKKANKSGCIHM